MGLLFTVGQVAVVELGQIRQVTGTLTLSEMPTVHFVSMDFFNILGPPNDSWKAILRFLGTPWSCDPGLQWCCHVIKLPHKADCTYPKWSNVVGLSLNLDCDESNGL